MTSRSATVSTNLLDELQNTLAHGTVARRVETLRRVTDLFLNNTIDYSDEQITVFDDVFNCLIEQRDISAKALLARRLAPIAKAPPHIIHTLAFDDQIEIAAPVLSQSERLGDDQLVANARSKSQAHLLAISTRKVLSGAVTDVLVERGNDEVIRSTVNNPGAEFSEQGFTRLVERAEDNDSIAHPGDGYALPVDSTPAYVRWNNGNAASGDLNSRDATFDVDTIDALHLASESSGGRTFDVPARPSVPVFDDSVVNGYWDPTTLRSSLYSVRVAGVGSMIQVLSSNEATGQMQVKAGSRFVAVTGAPSISGTPTVGATLTAVEKKRAHAEVKTFSPREAELPYALTLAQALPEGAKMDWIVEKAVELGAAAIVPLAAQRCVVRLSGERAEKKQAHWQGIVHAAAEQCGRNRLPHLAELSEFRRWVGQSDLHRRILLSPRGEQPLSAWARHHPPQAVTLIVGPEGGFNEEEEQLRT